MRFYGWDQGDIQRCVERSYLDAEKGCVQLALARIADIGAVLPNEAVLLYTEGVIRSAFLGEGLAARACFERAHAILSQKGGDRGTRWNAAYEIVRFTNDTDDLHRWVAIAQHDAPDERERERVAAPLAALAEGQTLQVLLQSMSQLLKEDDSFGLAASVLESALAIGGLQPDQEVEIRRNRAQQLRQLDLHAQNQRQLRGELFPGNERLALQAALMEIEHALALDEYDPELWNLKSAWCVLLGSQEEALKCANKALTLRPHRYAKPLLNQATALWKLSRREEALTAAREALAQAQESADAQHAQELIEIYSQNRETPSLDQLLPLIALTIHYATEEHTYADRSHNIRRSQVVGRVLTQAGAIPRQDTETFARLMAELLADFTPEAVFCVIVRLRELVPDVADRCVTALLHIVAYAGLVERHDATRCLVLTIMRPASLPAIRSLYRRLVLAPSTVSEAGLTRLDTIVREELSRMHNSYPQLIAEQEPISTEERRQAVVALKLGAISSASPGDREVGVLRRLILVAALIILVLLLIFAVWAIAY